MNHQYLAILCALVCTAGRVNGPGIEKGDLQPGQRVSTYATFRAKEFASVEVKGVGGDIDCIVFNEAGVEVDRDDDKLSSCLLSWIPPKEEKYTVRIVNTGESVATFYLETN